MPEETGTNKTADPTGKPVAGIVDTYVSILTQVIPLLDQIKGTIEESTGRIPGASRQLQSVTQDTESATMEILDVLETMTDGIAVAEKGVEDLGARIAGMEESIRRFGEELRAFVRRHGASPQTASLAEQCEDLLRATAGAAPLSFIAEALHAARRRALDIAMALQVQDITAQKIAGVNRAIESVREQLVWVLDRLSGSRGTDGSPERTEPETPGAGAHGSFDSEAQFTSPGKRQDQVDGIVEHWHRNRHGSY